MILFLKRFFNKYSITFLIFLFINFIFSVKYISRISTLYILISIIIVTFYFVIWNLKIKIYSKKHFNLIILLLFTFLSILLFYKFPIETINVDRWSVITSFWDTYLDNKYAYNALSNVGNPPGPMPFYFVLAFPFYLIGELGYFTLFGLFLFYYILKKSPITSQSKTIILLLILTSLWFVWEIICRSNIFLNGTIVLIVLIELLRKKEFTIKEDIKIGILIGLVISTRNVYVIPFMIAFVYLLKNNKINIMNTVVISIVTIIAFIITFIPFTWNHIEEFKIINPFIIQSSALMPFKLSLIFILISIISGFLCKSTKDVYFYSSTILFLTIFGYFLYHFNKDGFYTTFFENSADISYFILGIPFALYHLFLKN